MAEGPDRIRSATINNLKVFVLSKPGDGICHHALSHSVETSLLAIVIIDSLLHKRVVHL